MLCELFLQQLQSNVQMILASDDDMNISKLAKMADRIMDMATPMVTTVTTSTEDNHIRKMYREEINAAFPAQHRSCPQSLSNSKRGVGIIHVGGSLHVDVHLTDK